MQEFVVHCYDFQDVVDECGVEYSKVVMTELDQELAESRAANRFWQSACHPRPTNQSSKPCLGKVLAGFQEQDLRCASDVMKSLH